MSSEDINFVKQKELYSFLHPSSAHFLIYTLKTSKRLYLEIKVKMLNKILPKRVSIDRLLCKNLIFVPIWSGSWPIGVLHHLSPTVFFIYLVLKFYSDTWLNISISIRPWCYLLLSIWWRIWQKIGSVYKCDTYCTTWYHRSWVPFSAVTYTKYGSAWLSTRRWYNTRTLPRNDDAHRDTPRLPDRPGVGRQQNRIGSSQVLNLNASLEHVVSSQWNKKARLYLMKAIGNNALTLGPRPFNISFGALSIHTSIHTSL